MKMKKVIALSLIISIGLCCFTACDAFDDYYKVEVIDTTDSLIEPLKSRYEAGTLVEIKTYVIYDANIYVFLDGEKVPMSHYDSDYWGYKFVMPKKNVSIYLTTDPYYGKDEFEFQELNSWIRYLENGISKVSIKTTNFADEGSFIETRYSSKPWDVDNFKNILTKRLIKTDNSLTPTLKKEYSFIFPSPYSDEDFGSIYFYDELHISNDGYMQKFKFEDSDYVLPFIEEPDLITYSFAYDGRKDYVKKYDDDAFSLQYDHASGAEFIPYTGDKIDFEAIYYLDSSIYGKINLLTPTVFELNGEYYEIISGEDYWAYNYLTWSN